MTNKRAPLLLCLAFFTSAELPFHGVGPVVAADDSPIDNRAARRARTRCYTGNWPCRKNY
jgi:hypothetical protein